MAECQTAIHARSTDVSAACSNGGQHSASVGIATEQARLVLLVGHGSQTQNNPQRAGLDCGACCGQSGEVNARTLAALLNDQAVRQALPEYGISLRDDVHFIAALHNTTTEAMRLLIAMRSQQAIARR